MNSQVYLSKILNFVFKGKKIEKQLPKLDARKLCIQHMSLATNLIGLGFVISAIAFRLFGFKSLRIPILSKGVTGLISVMAMHRVEKVRTLKTQSTNLRCEIEQPLPLIDELIIGSGPGGSIAATHAIKFVKNVVVVESGLVANPSTDHHSVAQMMESFSFGGQEAILGRQIIPFAQGRVLGGGSAINSGLYHRIPMHLRETWQRSVCTSDDKWSEAETKIEAILKIEKQPINSLGIYEDSPLRVAAEKMGWDCDLIPRWRKYEKSKFTHFGMSETLLDSFQKSGGIVVKGHKAISVRYQNKTVSVEIIGSNCHHTLLAKHLVLAAGTVETPVLLLNSGLANKKELNFNFHAMSRLVGEFEWEVNDLNDIDPYQAWTSNYSAKFGAAVGTPELLSATLQTIGASSSMKHENLGVYYASTVPSGTGSFMKIAKNWIPVYNLSNETRNLIGKNTGLLKEGLLKAGATQILGKTSNPQLSSVHIFGSIPLGANSLIDELGQLKQSNGLIRICDASILPTAPIVNPQGPLLHLTEVISAKWWENWS